MDKFLSQYIMQNKYHSQLPRKMIMNYYNLKKLIRGALNQEAFNQYK